MHWINDGKKIRPIYSDTSLTVQGEKDEEIIPCFRLMKEVLLRVIRDYVYALREFWGKDLVSIALELKQEREKAKKRWCETKRIAWWAKKIESPEKCKALKREEAKARRNFSDAIYKHELAKNGLLAKKYLFKSRHPNYIFSCEVICKTLGYNLKKLREKLESISKDKAELEDFFDGREYFQSRRKHGARN